MPPRDDTTFLAATIDGSVPRLRPNLAEVDRQKVEGLHEALRDDATHQESHRNPQGSGR